jgi:hypothetical protein
MNWEPSEAAKAQNVCHTKEECKAMYDALPPELKAPAVAALAGVLVFEMEQLRELIQADPENWAAPFHSWGGMSVRNFLRKSGFGEDYFGVHNLDDIYVALIEEAVRNKGTWEPT